MDGWPKLDPDKLEASPIVTLELQSAGDQTQMSLAVSFPDSMSTDEVADWLDSGITRWLVDDDRPRGRHVCEHARVTEQPKTNTGLGGFGGRNLAKLLGPLNVWSFALQRLSAQEEAAAARSLEMLGYRAIWMPESIGSKEVMAHSALLLQATDAAIVAPGIASIHARDPMAMAGAAKTLGEQFPGRFVLGIGVSHAPSVETRGGTYANPLEQMRQYLDAMDAAQYAAPLPDPPVPLVLAALGPRMLELTAQRADGAHPYFVPVEHTPLARRHLGPDPALIVEQTAVLTSDRSKGLQIARAFARNYLALPNYANNLKRLGWSDADIAGDGSERLIDAVIAIGDADAIVGRIKAHLEAGADTVCLQLREEKSADPALAAHAEIRAAFKG